MKKEALFSASADIARRAGVIRSSYRTKEGRFILSETDLSPIRLKMYPEEYITGLDVISITEAEAKRLIAENGYQMGEQYVEEPETEDSSTSDEEELNQEEE